MDAISTTSTTTYPSNALQFLRKLERIRLNGSAKGPEVVQATVRLKIVIVGAGLGGLGTSIALARSGHQVTVLEQATTLSDAASNIHLPSNASRILRRWGLGQFLDEHCVGPNAINIRRWQNGAQIGKTNIVPDFREVFGAAYLIAHEGHLYKALYERAKELDVDIRFDSKVLKYDLRAPAVMLEKDKILRADLVIAADGIDSTMRRLVLGGVDQSPRASGFHEYTGTVLVDQIRDDPELAWLLDKPCVNIWIGPNGHAKTSCTSEGSAINIDLHVTDRKDDPVGPEESVSDPKDMRQRFSDWDPKLVKTINMIEKPTKTSLLASKPLRTWLAPSSRALILGDAAHPMLPYMFQNAAMTIEDSASLATILNQIPNLNARPFALKIWDRERLKRTGGMQDASRLNSVLWHFPDGEEQEARDASMQDEVDWKHFLVSANQWSDPVTQWWAFGHDAEGAIGNAWKVASAELFS